MDQQQTFKATYPERYQHVTEAPLLETTFSVLRFDEWGVPHFRVDPTAGVVTFSSYTTSPEHTKDVLSRIIENC